MSGTSADGVDAALVEWPDGEATHPFELLAYREEPFPAPLQQRVHGLAAARVGAYAALREFAALDVELAERFAAAAAALAEQAGVALADVDAIASHGQTVAHHPELRASLQIGDPSVIAERTGCTTIADFRTRDLAAGGEGAPLAPFFHYAALASSEEGRLALNLGGIANITWIPRGASPDDVVAFDVGPANVLVDAVVQLASDGLERMDEDGARAKRGQVDAGLLARLMDDPFLRKPPPKSTGRELYGVAQAETLLAEWRAMDRPLDDLIATLVSFTAEAIAHACRTHLGEKVAIDRVLVGGGGAFNPAVLSALRSALPQISVDLLDTVGVPAAAAEAMAFSLMGRNALLGLPNHLPRCTGASRAAVLGEIVPGASGRIRV